jgi:hypothetical protein
MCARHFVACSPLFGKERKERERKGKERNERRKIESVLEAKAKGKAKNQVLIDESERA